MNKNPPKGILEKLAKDDFDDALRKGYWRSVFSWLTQNDNHLLPFDEVRKYVPIKGQHYIGIRQIPMAQIVGSVGRYNDFDRAFLPRHRNTSSRWISIDQAHLSDIILPPIEVYKIGEAYFVKDGNHRVSVAKERGQLEIDAVVIEIDTDIQVDAHTDIDTLIRQQEQAYFHEHTRITELRPQADIRLTLPGGYEKLLEHITVHRYFMGTDLQRDISWGEAVGDWYDQVFKPMKDLIHKNNVISEFPGRTESDLYLWIIEHLWYLRETIQTDISMEDAVVHFADEYSQNSVRRLLRAFHLLGRRNAEEAPEEPPPPNDRSDTAD